MSLGYWGDQESTAKVLRPHPFAAAEMGGTGAVAHSSDPVKADEDGLLDYPALRRREGLA